MKRKILLGLTVSYLVFRWTGTAAEPFYTGLPSPTWTITTRSAEAERYFNQGLAFLEGFNRGAAIRSFQQASELDPACGMAHWAIAYASGPYINGPACPPSAAARAWRELQLARQDLPGASSVERALIEALACRYADPAPPDRHPLDLAYADAMRRVWQRYSSNPEVGVLFAEALLDLRPWDQWTLAGQPQPGTDEIVATLEAVLKLDADQPMANHLYIHTLEASPFPERASAAADRLRNRYPGLSHLLHMPSHIDVQCGRWQDAITANVEAIDADARYQALTSTLDADMPGYLTHNRHMLIYAAMMAGESKLALAQARTMIAETPPATLRDGAAGFDPMMTVPLEVLLRFGRWSDILAEPDYSEAMPFARAFHAAARAIACAALGKPAEATNEQAVYLRRLALVPPERQFGANSAGMICAVLTPMVAGEILVKEGKLDDGLAQLRAGVAAEDALHYSEPPACLLPVRHALAANLLASRRYAEAEQVCRADLQRSPENGWSLLALSRALSGQGQLDKAETIHTRFQAAWRDADVQVASSCLCQPGNEGTSARQQDP